MEARAEHIPELKDNNKEDKAIDVTHQRKQPSLEEGDESQTNNRTVATDHIGKDIFTNPLLATAQGRTVNSTPLSGDALLFVPVDLVTRDPYSVEPACDTGSYDINRSLNLEEAQVAITSSFAEPAQSMTQTNVEMVAAAGASGEHLPILDRHRAALLQRLKPETSPIDTEEVLPQNQGTSGSRQQLPISNLAAASPYTIQSPFDSQIPRGSRQQPSWPTNASSLAATPDTPLLQQLPPSVQHQSATPQLASRSPLTKDNKDRNVDQVLKGMHAEPVLEWLRSSSPVAKDDSNNTSPSPNRHRRLISSISNLEASPATTPPADSQRPSLRVSIPNISGSQTNRNFSPSHPQRKSPHTPTGPRYLGYAHPQPSHFKLRISSEQRTANQPTVRAAQTNIGNISSSVSQSTATNPAPSHTNSKTWTNPRTVLLERWVNIEKRLQKMEFIEGPDNSGNGNIQRSPFVPSNFLEYVQHCRLFKQDEVHRRKRSLATLEKAIVRDPRLPPPGPKVHIKPAFGGKSFPDNRSSVLSQFTIFSPTYKHSPDRPEAPWPGANEMAEEGDERYTSNFRRMTAVPRTPCNETVSWKQRPFLIPFPLDATWGASWRVPSKKRLEKYATLCLEMEEERHIGEQLIGQSLLNAIDCIGDEI